MAKSTNKQKQTTQKESSEENSSKFTLNYKQAAWIAFGIITSVATYVYWDFITLAKVFLYTDIGSDTVNTFYPELVASARYIREEGLPGWSWHHGMGQNFFPGGLDAPFKWILYALGPDRLVWGIGWVEWLKLVLTGLCFFQYFKQLKVAPATAILGTTILTLTGFMFICSGWYGHSEKQLLYLAFLLWSVEWFLNKGNWKLIPVAVMVAAGTRFYFFGMIIGAYLILRLIEQHSNWKQAAKQLSVVIGAALIGVLASSAWFLSIGINVLESPRVSGDASLTESLVSQSIFGLDKDVHYATAILRTFYTDLVGAGSKFTGWRNILEAPAFYCSLFTLLMWPQFLLLKDKKKWLYLGFSALWIIPVIFPWFRYAFNLFSGDYYKTGLSFILPFTLTYIAIRCWEQIDVSQLKKHGLVLVMTMAGLLGILWMDYDSVKVVESLQNVVTFWLIASTLVILLAWYTQKAIWAVLLLAIIVAVESGNSGHTTLNKREILSARAFESKAGYNDYTVDALASIESDTTAFYRVNKYYASGPSMHTSLNDAKVQDYYSSVSYSSFNQGNYINFLDGLDIIDATVETNTRWAPGVSRSEFLPLFIGTKYYLLKQPPSQLTQYITTSLGKFGNVELRRTNAYVPFGACLRGVAPASEFDTLPTIKKHMGVFFAGIVDDAEWSKVQHLPRVSLANLKMPGVPQFIDSVRTLGSRKVLNISKFSANEIQGAITLKNDELMYFPMPFDPRWTVTVDGKQKDLLKIDHGLTGLILPPGAHAIKLSYAPPMLTLGSALSLLGILLYVFSWFKDPFKGLS